MTSGKGHNLRLEKSRMFGETTHKIIFTQLGRVNWKWLKVVLFFHKIVFAVKNTLTQHFG